MSTTAIDKIDVTLNERGATYGKSVPNLACTQKLWDVLNEYWMPKGLPTLEEEQAYKAAAGMMVFKMARIICGPVHHPDHFTDIGGYGRLAENIAEGDAR